MRVLLVNPYMLKEDERESRLMHPYAPLGPLYVAATLENDGHDVRFFDATFEEDLGAFEGMLKKHEPDLVGVYTTFLSKANALRVGSISRGTEALVIAGGPDANVEPEVYLKGGFDAVVMGEGEATSSELASTLEHKGDWRKVAGLAHMVDGVLVRNPPRARVDDLDSIPFPQRGLSDVDAYARRWRERHGYFSLTVMTSRGCPYRCGFCSRPVFGRVHRKRSVGNIIEELGQIRERFGADRVRFADDILPIDKGWMLHLCEEIERADLGLEYECLARGDLMDREILLAMRRAGFHEVYFGVESGSDAVLERMGKGQTLADIRMATSLTREAGLSQHWFIMFGYPGEGLDDVESTISLVLDLAPESLSTTVAYPIKGTDLFDEVKGELTQGTWSQSDDTKLVFRNRYPGRFYRWTVFRVHSSLWLRRFTGGRCSPVLRLYDAVARAVSKVLAVEDGPWGAT